MLIPLYHFWPRGPNSINTGANYQMTSGYVRYVTKLFVIGSRAQLMTGTVFQGNPTQVTAQGSDVGNTDADVTHPAEAISSISAVTLYLRGCAGGGTVTRLGLPDRTEHDERVGFHDLGDYLRGGRPGV